MTTEKTCTRCGIDLDPNFIGHICRNPEPVINGEIRLILSDAIGNLVSAAGSAAAVKYQNNPAWQKVMDTLDNCCDELREVESQL